MARKRLHLLHPSEYEHPLDRQALNTLEGTPGLETLTRKFIKHFGERIYRLLYTGSCIKVNENNFPEVYNLFLEACEILHFNKVPELYFEFDDHINAGAAGSENPLVILTSGAVDSLTCEELLYIMGHELGHIKSGHMLYHQMAEILNEALFISGAISYTTLGISSLLSTGLELALLYWQRMSEFTADRAGLLACQNEDAVITAMIKMAGAPKRFYKKIKKKEFIKQAKEFKDYDFDALDKIGKVMLIMFQDHPWTVMRASEILKWVESGAYDDIIKKRAGEPSELELECPKCGARLIGNENFCGMCGTKIWTR